MRKILISDAGECSERILYILRELSEKLLLCNASSSLKFSGDRTVLIVEAEENFEPYLRDMVIEKVAEAICISFKYEFIGKEIKVALLSEEEREILLTELIAADLCEEVAYVSDLLDRDEIFQLDGFYTFRLGAMKEKWKKICDAVPPTFQVDQLEDFVTYLMEENTGFLYLKEGKVYSDTYRKLDRAGLIANDKWKLMREIILSGAKEVLCFDEVKGSDYAFLQKYYGDRAFFP